MTTLTQAKPNLLWLELTGCSGNIISLLDGAHPGFIDLVTSLVNFRYNNSLSAGESSDAMDQLLATLGTDFILIVEGAVATKANGRYTVIGSVQGKPLTALEALRLLGAQARHIVAVGSCATHGGMSAAAPNPSGCISVQQAVGRPVIQLPGCPCHPDWILGTLTALLEHGSLELDERHRPRLFYGNLIHDRCPRRSFFDQGIFARRLGESTCLFKLGCRGPVTRTDCPTRQWNQYVNWPVEDNTPCIGCAQFGFPDQMEPFISYDIT
ncbi:hydrogenase small subunit [Heliophilum fasciatum]|uniref:Hydrogenase small subunit n=1 Tax=Heliophilum fasciatum TaxID=35700 RepID=A0A4R2RW70_9FIRM|nr:hydrogenase small subunit [Heliophilum fasciatum]MCW2276847.1 hydrogenase small subunit [Heliophilum fasciatum]TCP68692.1 hydrogenase small subunit [Heliophilum fasciatum]